MMRGSLSRPKKIPNSSTSEGLGRSAAGSGKGRRPRASPTYGVSASTAIRLPSPNAIALTGSESSWTTFIVNDGRGVEGAGAAPSAAGGSAEDVSAGAAERLATVAWGVLESAFVRSPTALGGTPAQATSHRQQQAAIDAGFIG